MNVRRNRGAALVEFHLVSLVALLPLLLGILQTGLLMVGHHALGYAAFEAARAGAVDHARLEAMYSGLAQGLVPLLGAAGGEAGAAAARLRAEAEVRLQARIERLSPDARDFDDWGEMRAGRRYIPNDALEYRPVQPRRAGGQSLQAANHLRIRVRLCYPLVVPLVDRLLPPLLRRLDPSIEDEICYAAGRVPLRVQGSAPMQSEAWP